MNGQPDPAQLRHAMAVLVPLIGIFFVLGMSLLIVPLWMAFKKAGLAPALSLIALVPSLGLIIALFILAFAKWKVVPAPEYGMAYLPPYPPPGGYPPPYPPASGYAAPGAYAPPAPVAGAASTAPATNPPPPAYPPPAPPVAPSETP